MTELRAALARHGVRPDKRFGQHFLTSPSVVAQIVARTEGGAAFLEIGPGPGVLTAELTARGPTVVVELDATVLPVLADLAPLARVVHADALQTDLGALLESLPAPRVVVSNMPYNITGPLLAAVAAERARFRNAVLMMQREVAEKILAPAGDSGRGALSVVIQTSFRVEKVCHVPPGAFLPPPKVDSTVLDLWPVETGLTAEEEAHLFGVVRQGFVQPRKTLANNLAPRLPRGHFLAWAASEGRSPTVRPHELSGEAWRGLAAVVPRD